MHGSCDGTVTIFRRGQTGGASDVNDPAVVSNRIDGVDLKGDDRITERPFGERLVRVETDCQLVTVYGVGDRHDGGQRRDGKCHTTKRLALEKIPALVLRDVLIV